MNRDAICRQLTSQIKTLIDNGNDSAELLPDIRLLYGTQPGTRTPVMYQPGIVFLFSGHKIGYINERVFRYDTNEYLLLTVPLPFECETFATEEVPLADPRQRRHPPVAGAADGYWGGRTFPAVDGGKRYQLRDPIGGNSLRD